MATFSNEGLAQQIVACTPDGVIFADRGGVIRFWNAGAAAIFGFAAPEVVGQPLELIIPERLRARHDEGYRRVMQTGITKYGGRQLLSVPAMRKDGERISVEFSIAMLHDTDGALLGVAAVIRDVTARWRKEKELTERLTALEAKSNAPVCSPGPLHRFLADDHARLDRLLQRAVAAAGSIDRAAYAAFRAGLLKHIGMEEKILLPAAQAARGGEPLPVAAKLRLDHGAIAALLVPSPTVKIIAALGAILSAHNAIEEGAGGLYDVCEQLAGEQVGAWLARLRAAPEVPVSPYNDGPRVLPAARRTLERAGYQIELE